MPYIKIKAYPKDPAIKQRVAERINQVFLEEWGCPAEAISISMEEVAPEKWGCCKTSIRGSNSLF